MKFYEVVPFSLHLTPASVVAAGATITEPPKGTEP
jgi:hypothetical protein